MPHDFDDEPDEFGDDPDCPRRPPPGGAPAWVWAAGVLGLAVVLAAAGKFGLLFLDGLGG